MKRTQLSPRQAESIGVPLEGPCKPGHDRYEPAQPAPEREGAHGICRAPLSFMPSGQRADLVRPPRSRTRRHMQLAAPESRSTYSDSEPDALFAPVTSTSTRIWNSWSAPARNESPEACS